MKNTLIGALLGSVAVTGVVMSIPASEAKSSPQCGCTAPILKSDFDKIEKGAWIGQVKRDFRPARPKVLDEGTHTITYGWGYDKCSPYRARVVVTKGVGEPEKVVAMKWLD